MKLPTPLEAADRADEGHAIASGLGLDEVAALLRSKARGSSGSAPVPEGATHMRRPEYITAWLFDRVSTMPIWLIEKYKSVPLPDDKIGHYATAIDGEFYRWYDPAKFTELFTSVAQNSRKSVIEECAKIAELHSTGIAQNIRTLLKNA